MCASRRWATAVAKVAAAPSDPRTLDGWSDLVAASAGVIRAWCLLADVRPKPSLDLARLLRLVVRNQLHCAEDCLEISDPRTMTRLLRMGGIPLARHSRRPLSVEEFLARQTFVQSETCLRALRDILHQGNGAQPGPP